MTSSELLKSPSLADTSSRSTAEDALTDCVRPSILRPDSDANESIRCSNAARSSSALWSLDWPTPPAFEWPDGASVVINLVLVYEEGSEYSVRWGDDRNDGWGEYADAGVKAPHRDPGTEGHYEYGSRAGVWRLARIYDEAAVPVTVSGSAVALELNPDVCEWMRAHDHDLMGHGWRWIEAWHQTRDEEREHLRRAIDSYERMLGSRPVGWNCRSWPTENTRELLREAGGFIYDSDVCADDLPYYDRSGERPLGEPRQARERVQGQALAAAVTPQNGKELTAADRDR